MAHSIGIDGCLYRNTGTYGSPTWDLVDTVKDVKVNAQWKRGDGSTRASRVNMGANTSLDISISGMIRGNLGNTDFEAIWDAWKTAALLDVMALTDTSTTNGAYGVRFESQVVDFTRDEGNDTVVYHNFTFEPIVSDNIPDSVEVATGAAVFTDF